MDMIEVDPKLFVTCRLCLEELGQYQIIPSVQQQIKYCYDIDVEPFDGLPQLICIKCKEILSNFFTIKRILTDKQLNLRNKIPKKDTNDIISIQPQQDTVSSSQQAIQNVKEKKKSKPKQKRIHSSESENSSRASLKRNKDTGTDVVKWDARGFKKELVCTICDARWPQLKSLMNHRRSHMKLRSIYPSVFHKKCSVSLTKIDGKANITGMNNAVVYNNCKIVENCNSLFYYVKYSKENQGSLRDSIENMSENSFCNHVDPESTDTEQEMIPRPKRRKRRIISRSSNDTVVIESNSNKVISDNEDNEEFSLTVEENGISDNEVFKSVVEESGISDNEVSKLAGEENVVPEKDNPKLAEDKKVAPTLQISNDQCISIDDSSDSDTDKNEVESKQRLKPTLEAKLGDYKIIQGIINACVNAYERKNGSTERSAAISESQLRRKILAIGRKIINRQSFNSTGMLKFMEHRNLSISWSIKGIHNGKESNYIRIMPKLRGTDIGEDSHGWVPVPLPNPGSSDQPEASFSTTVQMSHENNVSQLETNLDTAIIFLTNSPDLKNKLLNANPVANPKQLPRKVTPINEFRVNKVVSGPCTSFSNNEDNDLCMPIITSTTSLAVPAATAGDQNAANKVPAASTNPETRTPRIKVKPVSELMSERMLNSLREQSAAVSTSNMLQNESDTLNTLQTPIENTNTSLARIDNTNTALARIENTNKIVLSPNVWVPQSMSTIFAPHIAVPQMTVASQPMHLVQISCVNPINVAPTLTIQNMTPTVVTPTPSDNARNKNEFVILNTVELPNTKTSSPLQYLKKLASMHDLILVNSPEKMSEDSICLIKFKVQFTQEPIDNPVVLCLSLSCFRNTFCFTVRDRNQKDLDINKISPNWQWEIIKIFRGDLVEKLLQNAQRHSRETHEYTNKFLCILKSINFQTLS